MAAAVAAVLGASANVLPAAKAGLLIAGIRGWVVLAALPDRTALKLII